MVNQLKIGVLGIQGAYQAHLNILHKLGVEGKLVKYRQDLKNIDGLIIPGGESTVFTKVFGFKMELEDIQIFANEKPVFGTCAGLILMAKDLGDFRVQQLGILNITVKRNAYGSQTESFESEITGCLTPAYQAIFIRAPKIEIAGDTVHICGSLNDDPVWVENDKHMGCSFHPELTEDTRIHAIFLDKIRKQIKKLQMA